MVLGMKPVTPCMLNNRGQTMREKLRDTLEQSLLGKKTMYKYAKEMHCLKWSES